MLTPYEKLLIRRLKRFLKKENLKQIELARRLNWTPSKLNDILKGRSPIGKNLLQQISDIGVSIDIEEKIPISFDEEDIEIAELAHTLTKDQKEALKTIILGLERKKHTAET